MPIYDYKCDTCGERFEKFQHFGDKPINVCPHGHETVHRVLTTPAIIFNGPGFYVTDNRSEKGQKPGAAQSAKTDAKCTACS
jgi:putative FmdB family regulatory protein